MIGTKLGSYQILEEVGRGGMAVVYRAYQPAVERFVAVKVIQRSKLSGEKSLERFQREARVIARLEHPHILPVYDFDGSHESPYIVMRYLDSGTLKDVLKRGPLPPNEIGHLLRQIGSALDYAHRQGIVHRDMKPSNVMLDPDGNAFVMDFGIARLSSAGATADLSGLTAQGDLVGTPDYMSPEQIMGKSDINYRTDIYALGAMLFEMLTGQLPYLDDSVMGLILKHLNALVPSVLTVKPVLPPDIDAVLMRAMAKDPDDRYDSASHFAEAAVQALGGQIVSAPTELRRVTAQMRSIHPDRSTTTLTQGLSGTTAVTTSSDQQKQMTVLYADVAEFEALLLDQHDAEQTNQVMQTLFARFEQLILAAGGTVYERTGQYLQALWGTASVREDDAERAIRTGLALLETLRTEGARYLTGADELPIQISLNTGIVLQQQTEGRAGTFTITGQTISVARQLAQGAPLGTLIATFDTYRHVMGIFDILALPAQRVRGRKEPVAVYQVLRAKPRAFRMSAHGVEGIEPRMVGRDAELKLMQDMLLLAAEDHETQIVTCAGEAGVGKSRLLYEFNKWVDGIEQRMILFQGRATQQSTNLPYALMRDVFSFRFQILDNDRPAVLRQKFEEGIAGFMGPESVVQAHMIAHLIGFDFSDSPYLQATLQDPLQFREQALKHLLAFLRAITAGNPAVIELEDIHWADDFSLDLINRLLIESPKLRLLVVCMTRPELYERRPAWGEGQPFHHRLTLGPLSKLDSRRFVHEVLQRVENLPTDLRDLIVDLAEGNPFYVEELIKVLIEDRVIVKTRDDKDPDKPDTWRVTRERLAHVRMPVTLTGVLQARLDSLPSSEKLLLQWASVIGRVFWDTALQALAEADHSTVHGLDHMLDDLRRRELIFQRETSAFAPAREYGIKHAILRDVIYDNLLKRQQRLYHAAAAAWLVATSGERVGEYTALISEHYERAGDNVQAAVYLQRAIAQAYAISAYEPAIALLERALRLLSGEEAASAKAERIKVLVQLGEVQSTKGDHNRAKDTLISALALARNLNDRQGMAQALAQLGRISIWQGLYTEASGYLEEGLTLARELNDQPAMVFILRQLGNMAITAGDYVKATGYLEGSLALARALNEPVAIVSALNSLGNVDSGLRNLDSALARYQEALTLARDAGNRYGVAMLLINMAAVHHRRDDSTAMQRDAQAALTVAREIGSQTLIGGALNHLSLAALDLGEIEVARQSIIEGIQILRANQEMPSLLDFVLIYARLQARTGKSAPLQPFELIGLVLAHPALTDDTRQDAQKALGELRAAMPPAGPVDDTDAALKRGAALSLDTVIEELLTNWNNSPRS